MYIIYYIHKSKKFFYKICSNSVSKSFCNHWFWI